MRRSSGSSDSKAEGGHCDPPEGVNQPNCGVEAGPPNVSPQRITGSFVIENIAGGGGVLIPACNENGLPVCVGNGSMYVTCTYPADNNQEDDDDNDDDSNMFVESINSEQLDLRKLFLNKLLSNQILKKLYANNIFCDNI
jgi:hypothetical protein